MARRVQSSEDTVEYRLFPALPATSGKGEVVKFLEEQVDIYLAHLSRWLVGYIWQSEPFHLRVVPDASSETGPPHLYGSTHYGDNVEDEWFIVFLLYQLTQAVPGLIAKVWDNDGEFMLIEAANSLPKWVQPDSAENRVYISGGSLHLVPPPESPAEMDKLPAGLPSISQALDCVRNPVRTLASPNVQKDIQARTKGFPEKTQEFIHHAHCYVPAALGAILDHSPQLVSPMVQAFFLRDPIDLKSCITMRYFRPGTRVIRRIKMTKCLYAQLMQQQFTPDRRSGWNLPASSNSKFKSQDLGMKLAHGAEILCSKCSSTTEGVEDLYTMSKGDVRWQCFINTLTQSGYFKGEMEGSRLYRKLLDDALKYYYSSVSLDNNRDDSSTGSSILRVLNSVQYDIEEMRRQERDLPSPDDDSWLNLSPEQLDDMLRKASGNIPPQDSFDLNQMSESMKGFMDNISSHEGAEFPKAGEDSAEVQFDPSTFMQTMQKMFEFEDGDSDSSTDMSEYGSDDDIMDPAPRDLSKQKMPVRDLPPSTQNKPKPPLPQTKPRTTATFPRQSKPPKATADEDVGDFLGMKDYMNIMDKQLAKTKVGQSFETAPIQPAKVNTLPVGSVPLAKPEKEKKRNLKKRVTSCTIS